MAKPKSNNDRHPDRSETEWRDPLKCGGEAWSAIVRALRGWFGFIPLRSISLTMTIAIERDIIPLLGFSALVCQTNIF